MISGFTGQKSIKKYRVMNRRNYLLKVLLLLIGISTVNFSYGQKGAEDGSKYGHGQDSIDCLTNISLYREYYRQKMYKDAVKYWRRAYNDCPYSTKNIYLDGVKMFKDFAEKELDVSKKEAFIDTMVLVYDNRIKYGFGEEAYVNQFKGLDILALRSDNADALKEVYKCFKISIHGLKDKAIIQVFQNFIKVGVSLYNQGDIDVETVVEDYIFTLDVLEKKGDANLINEINEQMVNSGIISCEQIINVYTPKFEANPEDKALLITITDFLDKLNCEDSDLYYKALSNRHKVDPTATSAKMLSSLALKKEKFDDAIKYTEEAIKLETDAEIKAALYLQLADAVNKKGNKPQARTYAYKAIELNPKS